MRDNGNVELRIEIHAGRPILAAEFLDDGCAGFGVPMTVDFGSLSDSSPLRRFIPIPGLIPKLLNRILERAGTQTGTDRWTMIGP